MPQEVIERVNQVGLNQGMPSTITYVDRQGQELQDALHEVEDDDSTYSDNTSSADEQLDNDSLGSGYSYDSDPDIDYQPPPDIEPDLNNIPHPEPGSGPNDHDPLMNEVGLNDDERMMENWIVNEDNHEYDGDPNDPPPDLETHHNEEDESTGVNEDIPKATDPNEAGENTGVIDEPNAESPTPTLAEEITQFEMRGQNMALGNEPDNCPKRKKKSTQDHAYQYFHDKDNTLELSPELGTAINLLTEQMSAKKGLRSFGEAGADAIKKELEQLVTRKAIQGQHVTNMTIEECKNALKYLMFLKEKRYGKIKARGYANRRRQCLYKTKEETSSPTISIESLFLTCVIDAMENRCVATCDIPGAFMHADMDEVVHVKLEGKIAKLLLKVDSSYNRYLIYEHNRPVIYTKLNKALYGTLQAALLFWTNLKKIY